MTVEKTVVIVKAPDWSHRATMRLPHLWDKYTNIEHPFEANGMVETQEKPTEVVDDFVDE